MGDREFESISLQRRVTCELGSLGLDRDEIAALAPGIFEGDGRHEWYFRTPDGAAIIVVENGRRKKISKREAIITQLVNKSASADLKATQIVLAMLQDVEARADDSSDSATFTEADQEIIQRIQARRRNENG